MTGEPYAPHGGLESGERTERVARLVDQWLRRRADGEEPIDLETLLDGNADVAAEVREQLSMIRRFDAGFNDTPAPHATLGDYHLLREIGRGGMGVVYEAEQISLGRRVALKILPQHLFLAERTRRRFQLEARAAARLLHPSIVAVHDIGEHEGTLYYAMQYIAGRGLDGVLDELRQARRRDSPPAPASRAVARSDERSHELARALLSGKLRLCPADGAVEPGDGTVGDAAAAAPPRPSAPSTPPPAAALSAPRSEESSSTLLSSTPSPGDTATGYFRSVASIGVQVADALAYAHERGIIHRDIKPSNLLLGLEGSVWVTDFGLAKTDENEALTLSGDVIGTVRYMSPERFRGWSDPRGDVYALGATLYELLTLQPLFREGDRTALIHRILNDEPAAPRSVDAKIPRDLETIVRKALHKDIQQRYQNAGALKDDLKRYLEGRPIVARPISRAERGWLWCRRNPLIAGLAGAVVVLLVAVAAVASVMALRLDHKHEVAIANLWQANLNLARSGRWSQDYFQRTINLGALTEAAQLKVTPELRDEAVASLCLTRVELASTRALRAVGALSYVDVDAALECYAAREEDGVVRARRLSDDAVVLELPRTFEGPTRVAFGPRGRFLATESEGRLELWDRRDPASVFPLPWCELLRPRFSGDGRLFVVEVQERARVYDLDARRPSEEFAAYSRYHTLFFPAARSGSGPRRILGLSPDRRDLDLIDPDAAPGGRVLRTFAHESQVVDAAYCEERRLVATANLVVRKTEFKAHIWDAETGDLRFELAPHLGAVVRVAFVCGGELVTTHSWDGQSRIWEASSGRLLARDDCYHLSLPDGGGRGARVQHRALSLLTVAPGNYRTLGAFATRDDQGPIDVDFLQAPDWLLSTSTHGVKVWDVASARLLRLLEIGDTYSVRPDPAGRGFYTAGVPGVFWWPLERVRSPGGRLRQVRCGPPAAIYDQEPVYSILDVSADGELLAFGHGAHAHVYRTGDRTQVFRAPDRPPHFRATVSPDGRWLACGNWNGKDVHIYDLRSGALAASLPAFGSANGHFTPDGEHVVVAASAEYVFYSLGDWVPRRRLERGGNNMHGAVDFARDGGIFAVRHSRRVLRIHDSAPAATLLSLDTPEEEPLNEGLALSPDGRWLAAGSRTTRRIHVWDLAGIARGLGELGIAHDMPGVEIGRGSEGRGDTTEDAAEDTAGVELEVDLGILAPARWKERELGRWTSRIREQPTLRVAYQRRAALLYALGRHREALADRERSLELEPDSAQAMNNIAWQHVVAPEALRDVERAVELARAAVAREPANRSYLNTLAGALLRAGRHAEALEVLRSYDVPANQNVPEKVPVNQGEAHGLDTLFLAMAQHHLGRPEAARAAYQRALEWARRQESLEFVVKAEMAALEQEVAGLLGGAAGDSGAAAGGAGESAPPAEGPGAE